MWNIFMQLETHGVARVVCWHVGCWLYKNDSRIAGLACWLSIVYGEKILSKGKQSKIKVARIQELPLIA